MTHSDSHRHSQGSIPMGIKLILGAVGLLLLVLVVIQLIPADPMKHYNAAVQAFENKDGPLLLSEYEKFSQYEGYESQKQLLEGMKWIVESRPLKAIPLLEAALQDEQTHDEALLYLGLAYRNAEMYIQSIETLERGLEEGVDPAEAHSLLVATYHDVGAFTPAVESAAFLIDNDTNLQNAYRVRGEVHRKRGEYAEAAADLEAALLAAPPDMMTTAIGVPMLRCFFRTGNVEKAKEYKDIADSGQAQQLMQAQILLLEEQFEEAYLTIRQAVGDMGAEPLAYVTMARAVLKADPERARETLEMIRAELPALNRNADLYDALADLAQAVDDPEKAELYRQNRDKIREIEEQYRQLASTDPPALADPQWRFELGDLAAELREYELARFWYETVRKLDPSLQKEFEQRMEAMYAPREELVPTTGTASDAADPASDTESNAAADEDQEESADAGGVSSPGSGDKDDPEETKSGEPSEQTDSAADGTADPPVNPGQNQESTADGSDQAE